VTTPKLEDKKSDKLSVKKNTLKDLKVSPTKQGDVKGGGGRYNPSQPKTPSDPGCNPCS